MDLKANKELYYSLKEYNDKLSNNYGNTVLETIPLEKKIYPYTIFRAIRDTSIKNQNSCYGKASQKGYRIDIYAQDKGTKYPRDVIAETIAEKLDDFMSFVGLDRISFNSIDNENEGTTLHLIITYSGVLDEYRRKFI